LRRMSKWTTSHARRSKRRPLLRMHPSPTETAPVLRRTCSCPCATPFVSSL
jgi:hypothetical protein